MSGTLGLWLGFLAVASCWCCWHLGRDRGRWEVFSLLDDETREEIIEREGFDE
jgi:hypothetical protein